MAGSTNRFSRSVRPCICASGHWCAGQRRGWCSAGLRWPCLWVMVRIFGKNRMCTHRAILTGIPVWSDRISDERDSPAGHSDPVWLRHRIIQTKFVVGEISANHWPLLNLLNFLLKNEWCIFCIIANYFKLYPHQYFGRNVFTSSVTLPRPSTAISQNQKNGLQMQLNYWLMNVNYL